MPCLNPAQPTISVETRPHSIKINPSRSGLKIQKKHLSAGAILKFLEEVNGDQINPIALYNMKLIDLKKMKRMKELKIFNRGIAF